MRRSKRGRLFWILLFLMPNLTGFLIFTAGPVAFSFVMSFSNWNLQQTVPFEWIGLRNFADLFTDQQFWVYFINTVYLMLGIPIAVAGSLGMALLLSQKIRGQIVYRTMLALPSFTSGVALMILWKNLYNPEFGPINAFLNFVLNTLHLNGLIHTVFGTTLSPPEWLISPSNLLGLDPEKVRISWQNFGLGARDALIIMGIWTGIGGSSMLLYLAALTNVPEELVEAAQLDGAGPLAVFRHVTWPSLAPTTFFIVIMSCVGGLQGGFEQARVMTGGGPAGTTTTISYYIYTKAFEEFQVGYASAVSWMLFAIIFAVTILNWKFGNKEMHY